MAVFKRLPACAGDGLPTTQRAARIMDADAPLRLLKDDFFPPHGKHIGFARAGDQRKQDMAL
jgi:hypothetical protein